jgi:pyruvate/2-oxoglutarate dehydrogenase complex dihydrolipoamide dehydrogenase (E3) component
MYDLVIVGASPEGVSAAQQGIKNAQTARIALITQGWETLWGQAPPSPTHSNPYFAPTDLAATLRELKILGVDVIHQHGHFEQTETGLTWQTAPRSLTAKAYLLTTDRDRYQATQASTAILNSPHQSVEGKRWGIWGAFPENLRLAQTLAQSGHTIQLLTRNAHLLPGEDREMSHLLQCYLDSIGVTIWCQCHGFRANFNTDDQTYRLSFRDHVGSQQVTVDSFWRSPYSQLPWHWFNLLPTFQPEVTSNAPYLAVNQNLQTSHPQIYACGSWLKGYGAQPVALQEAHYVVDRLLGKSDQPINYAHIPFGIDIDPPWHRVGLSEQQAAEQYNKIYLHYGYEPYRGDSPLRGVVKIISNQQGHIVGAHWFGAAAPTGISLLTLAIIHNATAGTSALTVKALQDLPVMDVSIASVFQDLLEK